MSNDRLGRCYELAGKFVLDNPDCTLVHGTIYNPGTMPGYDVLKHAWVERAAGPGMSMVWEPAGDLWLPAALWYSRFRAEVDASYSRDELRAEILESEHWGPWQ